MRVNGRRSRFTSSSSSSSSFASSRPPPLSPPGDFLSRLPLFAGLVFLPGLRLSELDELEKLDRGDLGGLVLPSRLDRRDGVAIVDLLIC